MELIDQHTKAIMEGCKERARDAGLRFQDESLEYIVTNRDLLELSPKIMIPTLYDYWVHDVEVLKEKGKYELYPGNPYETVINTRPPISFYNDNNPDWLNVMIFYHVLGHIDFFQNNLYFRHTWDYDFTGEALSDKRMIARLRSEKGRWPDYIIEFSRSVDNLVSFHDEISKLYHPEATGNSKRLDFYFDVFLQSHKKVKVSEYVKELERYNNDVRQYGEQTGETSFFAEVERQHPEFNAVFKKSLEKKTGYKKDVLSFIAEHSESLNKEENKWKKQILEVVRKTSLFFQPQIRTKIMNEGWASYWHETLFLKDDRIKGHEVDFARVNAGVTSMPRVGLNPYALGMRIFYFIEELANKGKYSQEFRKIADVNERKNFDKHTGDGQKFIFKVRENFSDFTYINTFVDQDFVTSNNLFVTGKRLNQARQVWEYYVKSRKAEDYRKMLFDSLYHPPHVTVDPEKTKEGTFYMVHHFEEKPLVQEFIHNTLMGVEYLWGGPVQLETSEVSSISEGPKIPGKEEPGEPIVTWQRVLYTMEKQKLSKKTIWT